MIWSGWDSQWKLWTWQRFQQLVGAALVAAPTGYFLFCMTQGSLPADFHRDISVEQDDHRIIDHNNIGYAIGSCRLSGDVSTWSSGWLRTLGIARLEHGIVTLAQSESPPATTNSGQVVAQPHDQELTAFEQAALWQSSRILQERTRFLNEAQERQDRARRNQLRILCLSAAGAFLVALRALAGHKDDDAPFRSLTKGALLPISVLALLMPVLATVVSGVATFDGDPNIVLRDVRTLAQLEQLHGRIAEDVTSDPFLCPIMRAAQAFYRGNDATTHAAVSSPIDPAMFNQCMMDRMARTVAWEQRHEQILNDAAPALAHAGDLPRPADTSKPARQGEDVPARPAGDVCQTVLGTASGTVPGARMVNDATLVPQKS
jgi:hypothetical protein